ncbi:MAG: hypothetical protein ACK51N_06435 [bacterium]|jgi:hypothetical protein|nr:hypothetical protein [Planctomycetaceae bacterium]
MTPLLATVLDLDHALGGNARLLLGGGLGLFLKQQHLRAAGLRTLLPIDRLPPARTTQDIDLFLPAQVIASHQQVLRHRAALDALGFAAVPGAQWLKFQRTLPTGQVLLDLLVGPLADHADQVTIKGSRVRPRGLGGSAGLHAFATAHALGIEATPLTLPLAGLRSDGTPASCSVRIPLAFTYALMKLAALRDRIDDPNKQLGRHHAMDLYRIAAMLTEPEAAACDDLARAHAGNPELAEAVDTIDSLLAPSAGIGRIRLLEYHRLSQSDLPAPDADWLVTQLRRLLRP